MWVSKILEVAIQIKQSAIFHSTICASTSIILFKYLYFFAVTVWWSCHGQASVLLLLLLGGCWCCVHGGGAGCGSCGVDGGRGWHGAVGWTDGHLSGVMRVILKCDRGWLQGFIGHGREGRRVDRGGSSEFSRPLSQMIYIEIDSYWQDKTEYVLLWCCSLSRIFLVPADFCDD